MTVSKCIKCGATLPSGAAFCPSCGAPKEEEQNQQPVHRPVGPQINFKNLFEIIFSKTIIITGIALGILLAWISLLIMVFASGSSNIAIVLNSIGFTCIGLLLTGGGIFNNNIDKYVRLAMVLIGGYIILMSLSLTATMLGTYSQIFRFF
ncbi:MAG: zinc-ribbon domain-containing protein [Thermoplasmatota archaeon]|jgi:hypothetical protein